jgi:predicted Rossmann-fold nucleotide-binding protein
VFHNQKNYWGPLFELFRHTVEARLTPPEFLNAWTIVDRAADILPALRGRLAASVDGDPAAVGLS